MSPTRTTAILLAGLALAAAACGGDDASDATATSATTPAPAATAAPPKSAVPTTTAASATTAAPSTTEAPDTTAAATTAPPTTAAGPDWRDQVAAICDHHIAGEPPDPDGSPESFVEWVAAVRELANTQPPLDVDGSPMDPDRLAALAAQSEMYLTAVETAAAASDPAAAFLAINHYYDVRAQTGAVYILAGASCAGFDASRASGASLNVPLTNHPWQLAVAFDSVWVSAAGPVASPEDSVTRVDPVTGETLATLFFDSRPIKMQPADGRLWVATDDAFVAIDPVSNTVSAMLAWADVGPGGGNKWAVDGALWICDGQRLHRYDPTTVERVATVEVGFDCGKVYATTDLVVTSTYNADPGESGASVAAFIDPATNAIIATLPLPVDVGLTPTVLADAVFFPGDPGSTAVVVDRATWTITATPDLGRPTGSGAVAASDGTFIYLPTVDSQSDPINGAPDVLVVDSTTFEVTDTIETLGANSIAAADGSIWVVDSAFGILQRFDVD